MFRNIIVAYDGSEHARKAAELAGNLARKMKGEVIVRIVTVMDAIPWEMGEPYMSQRIEQRSSSGQGLLDEAEKLVGPDLDIHQELLFGSPADSIIQVAETRDCDLIIMGTRGLGSLKGLLLGSQAQKVISVAPCPVLVTR